MKQLVIALTAALSVVPQYALACSEQEVAGWITTETTTPSHSQEAGFREEALEEFVLSPKGQYQISLRGYNRTGILIVVRQDDEVIFSHKEVGDFGYTPLTGLSGEVRILMGSHESLYGELFTQIHGPESIKVTDITTMQTAGTCEYRIVLGLEDAGGDFDYNDGMVVVFGRY